MIMKKVRLNHLKENGIGNCMRDGAFSWKSRKRNDRARMVEHGTESNGSEGSSAYPSLRIQVSGFQCSVLRHRCSLTPDICMRGEATGENPKPYPAA